MKTKTTTLTIGLLISILIGNMACSQENKKAAMIDVFPEATLNR